MFSIAIACAPGIAAAGGLMLPGAGAVSTSRAGAGVASADDGEAIVLNPAGIAKSTGTTITISAAIIDYAMQFQRRGTYDAVPGQSYSYAGQPYAAVRNDASPSMGIGSFQPIPVIAVITDLGGRVPGLHLGIGVYAPNAYPFRDMCTQLASGCKKYAFNTDPMVTPTDPPPGTRYDIMSQEAAVFLPSLVVAYSILPNLDVGLRLSAGLASIKSKTTLWGSVGANYEEDVAKDATFAIDAKDNFVPAFGVGATFRPTPNIEVAFNYSSELDIHAKGTSVSALGPGASVLGPLMLSIGPTPDAMAKCATGGTLTEQKACVDFALPMTAQLAGRYKLLDDAGKLKADVELDLDWEQWGKTCADADFANGTCTSPGDFRVVADSSAYAGGTFLLPLNQSVVHHGLQNTYGVRVGGSYHIPVGPPHDNGSSNEVILRGGLGYETAAAKAGWLRADFDGAARTTLAIGAAYRTQRMEISLGGGAILEGSPSNPNVGGGAEPCNPGPPAPADPATLRCGAPARQGPDPVNPTATSDMQFESPVNQGDYKSHYVMFMLGVTTWF